MEKARKISKRIIKFLHRYRYLVVTAVLLFLIVITAPMGYTFLATRGDRYDLGRTSINQVPFHREGIVFGAGILPDGTPTPYLRWRIQTAVKLYKSHRVDGLLMTGDNSTTSHDEPVVMRNYAVKLGIPSKAITLDYAGFNTYDSCYRAKAIFGLTDATLVTQGYHLPRAMSTCSGTGIQNVGVIAEHPARDFTFSYIFREFISTDKMVIQLILKPNPTVLGKPLPIH